jgi:hypothetical protein
MTTMPVCVCGHARKLHQGDPLRRQICVSEGCDCVDYRADWDRYAVDKEKSMTWREARTLGRRGIGNPH